PLATSTLVPYTPLFRSEPGHAAQCRLPHIAPQAARPDKGFVVEAGRKQRCDTADQRADIMAETRPGMLARRLQPVIQRDVRGTRSEEHTSELQSPDHLV